MAKTSKKKPARKPRKEKAKLPFWRRWRRWVFRTFLVVIALVLGLIALNQVINPGQTFYMRSEAKRLGGVDHIWVPLEEVAPVMARSVVAAEDANFCLHWGFDVEAIRAALEEGGGRGASTISQQVVKNVYLWQGRNWLRKALEAVLTPVVETFWTKRRIIEVYLNVAEFDEGVFGIDAAAQHYFGVTPAKLTPVQAARLAAVLPNPKARSASKPTKTLRRRAQRILDGAETIRRDGRAACFED
ncbi:monofunctional biosynthetic peptidoglycan transglycosylase [Rhodalgimonas zhirmunskyi]|uniref:Biosynthetic peptidoglycan transglycosylase n=1 Tax=Rhodalgimonas zhirmunskyi TaxID=2964767 RepID=A0AAJ1U787_9RHOB|nr:monofunctional biosynthetic peptidoglycan transglycosylase [Rhodoalgimonas zhirmunskyi]MDQ2094295.1 monofunctional biosynthetic peptidoglycan transglycosylase [Rhodoalgimonas zhirmunskyi]